MKKRCEWCGTEPIYVDYHDNEWGVLVHDERLLFEMIVLDGAQAGLSWITVLKKRDSYREAFDNFDARKVADYNNNKIEELLKNPGIIRNRLKVKSAVKNAKVFLKIQDECGSFDKYIWQFVNHRPIQNKWKSMGEIPAKTAESDAMSKDLKKWGFSFVGSTICYAFMQAAGMVNDHAEYCYRYNEVKELQNYY